VYITWRYSPVPMPQIQLVAVNRAADIKSGETRNVVFTINSEQLRVWDDKQGFVYHAGNDDDNLL